MATFAENLKELRKAAHITQAELAEKLNVHLQTVSKWERGVSEPDIAQVGDLAAAVGVPLERLVGRRRRQRRTSAILTRSFSEKILPNCANSGASVRRRWRRACIRRRTLSPSGSAE